uniref:Uncharacterized protein n=1 Tax=Panagrolaimus sp. JU765 TaxID=591449 RepID=A0AC34R7U5_9BILA
MKLLILLGFLFVVGAEYYSHDDFDWYKAKFDDCYAGIPFLNMEEDFQIHVDDPTKKNAFKNTIQKLCTDQFIPRATKYYNCAESVTKDDAERANYDMKYAQFYLDFCNSSDPTEFVCRLFPEISVTGFNSQNYRDDFCLVAWDMNKFYNELYANCSSMFDIKNVVETYIMENHEQLGGFSTLEPCLEEVELRPTRPPTEATSPALETKATSSLPQTEPTPTPVEILFDISGFASSDGGGFIFSDYDENFKDCYGGTTELNMKEDFKIRVDNPTKENAFKNTVQTLCIEQFTPRANRYHRCAESLIDTDAERAKYDMNYAQFYLDFCNAPDPRKYLCRFSPKVSVTGFCSPNYKHPCPLALDMYKFYGELYANCSSFDITAYIEKFLMENHEVFGVFKTLDQCFEENKPTPPPDQDKFYDCVGHCVLDAGHGRSKRFPNLVPILPDDQYTVTQTIVPQEYQRRMAEEHKRLMAVAHGKDFKLWCKKVHHSDIFSKCSNQCAEHHPELATARLRASQFITDMCRELDEKFINFTKCFNQAQPFTTFIASLLKTPPLEACPFALELHKYLSAETCAVEKQVIEIMVDDFVLQFSRMQKTFDFKQVHLCLIESVSTL